jgi:flagellar hook-length control protein FliK
MNEHQVQALFVSAHASVRAAVEAALPQLRNALADSGISLGNTSVGAESQPQSAFADSQNGQPERGAYRGDTGPGPAGGAARPTAEAPRALQGAQGTGVDTYA